ncbi:DUF5713 family protein [uncultured Cetobacterium sp.]|uniref:DUF5713 family protein n=1 Tax=uncultured Cetobacterium sp. TaxID=527638 RepID=UPI0026076C59|nr:DUF5713 family protein [uncultured Cetobacterium sp.]
MKYNTTKLLQAMYDDEFYQNYQVDNIKNNLLDLINFIERQNSLEDIKHKLDDVIIHINQIGKEQKLDDKARDCIISDILSILKFYGIKISLKEISSAKEW